MTMTNRTNGRIEPVMDMRRVDFDDYVKQLRGGMKEARDEIREGLKETYRRLDQVLAQDKAG